MEPLKKGLVIYLTLGMGLMAHANAGERTHLSKVKEQKVTQTKKEKYTVLKEPKTVEELLKNLKYAYDHDWFLNDDFYAESTLKRVLGSDNDELHTHYFNNHGDEVDSLTDTGMLRSLGFNFKYRQHHSDKEAKSIVRDIEAGYDKTGGGLSLSLQPGAVFFEEAEAVFGAGWVSVDPDDVYTNGWTPSTATSEYGNSVMVYHRDSARLMRTITILTNEDGSVDNLRLSIQEKK